MIRVDEIALLKVEDIALLNIENMALLITDLIALLIDESAFLKDVVLFKFDGIILLKVLYCLMLNILQ